MKEYKRRYESEATKGDEMKEKIEKMEEVIENLESENVIVAQASQK